MTRRRSGSIKADLQSPRTKLLYFLHCTTEGKLEDLPGLKSKLSKALGYTSDGNFYYDLKYLKDSGFVQEKDSCIVITEEGRNEFELHTTLAKGGAVTFAVGITLIWYYWAVRWGLLQQEGIPVFGAILVAFGFFLASKARLNAPKLPKEAKQLLRELGN